MNYNIAHFKHKEFACSCCGRVEVAASLVCWLEILRRAWGAPIHVNSGYRCLRHNTNVGGSKTSRHMIGCAADIRPAGKMDTKFIYLAHRLFSGIPGNEYVKYDTFLHVAVPRTEAGKLWDGNALM
jgi:uncharacterized protein YcbK (DUF882 family)